MTFRSLLRALTARPTRDQQPPAARRLSVEALEDRFTPAAVISVGDVTVVEGNDGTQNALVNVYLSEPHGNSVTVDYRTADSTAAAGSDYTAVSGKLTFTKNELTKTIPIPVRGDRAMESDESFVVNLTNSKAARIADGQGVVTINDNEPRVSITSAGIYEGNDSTTQMSFTVSLRYAYDQDVTVDFATADGSAVAGEDYVAKSDTLTILKGDLTQTILVEVKGDATAEPDESFSVNLTGASANAALAYTSVYGTIYDDDGYYYYDPGYYDYGYYDYGYYGYYDYGYYYYGY